MTRHIGTVPLDDDFLRDDLTPEERERRRRAVEEAEIAADAAERRIAEASKARASRTAS